MNYLTAKQTVAKLFGPGFKLQRWNNRCFLLRADGLAVADGRSWLECLRSYGEVKMLENARADAEARKVKAMIDAFQAAHPEIDASQKTPMTEEQLKTFDAFAAAWVPPAP